MMAINPNDAPEGFEAVESKYGDCSGCAFLEEYCRAESHQAFVSGCFCEERNDGAEVIFIPRTYGPVMATANFPYDSEGTPVEVEHA